MQTLNKYYLSLFLFLGVVVVLNMVADEYSLRLDFTADRQYTLSKATLDIMEKLEEPVTVRAYFSENLPPDIAKTRRDFRDLLSEYAGRSGGMVVYEFINPNENEEKEREAMQNGVSPVMINVREKDQMKQQKAYLGAVLSMGTKKETIAFLQPGAAMEYALTTGIKKISVKQKPVIGVLQGHGEPSLAAMEQVRASLSVLYEVREVALTDTTPVPQEYKTLAIVAPGDSFPPSHLSHLDAFLARGGSLFIALNTVKGDFMSSMGSLVTTGLEGWLKNKGLEVGGEFVIDVKCGAVTVQQKQGPFVFNSNVSFPFLPVIQKFADHPVTKGIEGVVLQFASPIRWLKQDSAVTFTPLAFTSERSGVQPAPAYFDIRRQWAQNDFPLASLPVGGVVQGKIVGDKASRIVVFSDGDFPVNGEGQGARSQQPDNISLMANSIDWLSDDTGLIDLRTKGVTSRPIDQLEDTTKTLLKYLNFLLPALLVIIYGIIRMQVKRNIRVRRMEENYA